VTGVVGLGVIGCDWSSCLGGTPAASAVVVTEVVGLDVLRCAISAVVVTAVSGSGCGCGCSSLASDVLAGTSGASGFGVVVIRRSTLIGPLACGV